METTLPQPEIAALLNGDEQFDAEDATAASSPARFAQTARRLLILIALYTVPAVVVMRPVDDPDLWWHLRTGQWIVAHANVPVTDSFSSFGHEKPWIAYSWLFDVLTYVIHQRMGLPGIFLFRVLLAFAVAVAIHRFVAKREPRFLVATGLVGISFLPIDYLLSERPWLFTVLFFTMTMDAVLDLRTGRSRRVIWLLPLVYALWANLHIQFIHGLFLLGLASAAPVVDRLFALGEPGKHADRAGSRAWWQLVIITIACSLATLGNPYGLHLYGIVLEYATQTGAYDLVEEHLAMDFRAWWNWALLVLSLVAAFALGRRRRPSSFEVLLLAAAAYLSFHSRRDLWFMVLTALAVVTTGKRSVTLLPERFALTPPRLVALGVGVIMVLAASGWRQNLTLSRLNQAVREKYPVEAADFVEKEGYGGPLYNPFDWGGYLIWRLPELPVAMDGRTNLHGVARIVRSFKTWGGEPGWDSDPELLAARLVMGPADSPLASLLRCDSRFELVYRDRLTIVFVSSGVAKDRRGDVK
jgi:hypothetical protein